MSPLRPDLAPAAELALRNLAAWTLQVGFLVWAAAVVARLLPLERPTARLRLWQALLTAAQPRPTRQRRKRSWRARSW